MVNSMGLETESESFHPSLECLSFFFFQSE